LLALHSFPTRRSSDLLREKYSGAHLFLLIGDDNLAGLPSWRGFEDLRHIVTFIVLQRAFTPVGHEYLSVDRRIVISATEIRNRIDRKSTRLNSSHLVI